MRNEESDMSVEEQNIIDMENQDTFPVLEIIHSREWINKPCDSDKIFIQSLVNEFDTLTIDKFKLSDSFYSQQNKGFTITINEKIEELKNIFIPKFTICKNKDKITCISLVYGSSIIHPECDFFFELDSTNLIKYSNGTNEIKCYWSDPKWIDSYN